MIPSQSHPGEWRTPPAILGPDGQPLRTPQEIYGVDAFPVPHVWMFNAMVGGSWRTYRHGGHDEAIRNDPEFAIYMRNNPHTMSMLKERQLATATKRWQIQVGDPKNLVHKAIATSITRVLEETPYWMEMTRYLLEAIWYGRYGAELDWRYKDMLVGDPDNPANDVVRPVPYIHDHLPVDGDKIGHHFDGCPYIQVSTAHVNELADAAITNATNARAILLRGDWRRKFILHRHEVLDANFRVPWAGDSIHGVGIRSTLFWVEWMKRELLGNILEYCERTGLGLKVWYYQGGNKKSEEEVTRAASAQTNRTNLVMPRFPGMGGKSVEGVEVLDTSTAGAALLMTILQQFDDWIERLVIGQTLSSGTEGSGLGGSGVANLHADTKFNLTSYDAVGLGETFTRDLAKPLLGYLFPKFAHLPCKFAYTLVIPNPIEALNAIVAAYGMGVDFDKDEIREIAGGTKPEDGDEVVSMDQQMAAMGGGAMAGGPQEQDYAGIMQSLMGGEPKGGDGAAANGASNGQMAMV